MNNMMESSQSNVIWGTNVNVTTIQSKFRHFIENFTLVNEDSEMIENESPLYYAMISEMKLTEHFLLDLDCDHLYQHDQALYKQLENYPAEVLECFDYSVTELFRELCMKDNDAASLDRDWEQFSIQTRPYNMRNVYHIRGLDPVNIDKLVCLKGIIIRVSSVMPDMQAAFY